MARSTLRVYINRTARPGWRGLTTMAASIGASAAIEARRAVAFVIEARRDAHLRRAVIMGSATVTGGTARGHRAKTENVVFGMGLLPVRSSAA